jgi:hypothetical protein
VILPVAPPRPRIASEPFDLVESQRYIPVDDADILSAEPIVGDAHERPTLPYLVVTP